MKRYFLVKAFLPAEFRIYHPNPCVFETKEEADLMCETLIGEGLPASYDVIELGGFKKLRKKKTRKEKLINKMEECLRSIVHGELKDCVKTFNEGRDILSKLDKIRKER